MKVHKPDMVKGRNLLFYNKIRIVEEQIEVAGENLSFYEGLAFVLEEASDRNGEELELEELEELEKLVKITNEKLEKLEEQREAQVNFWENIHKSRVLSATVHPRSGLKMRILYQRAFLVRDGGEGTSLQEMDTEIGNLRKTIEEACCESDANFRFVEQQCIAHMKWQLDTLKTQLQNKLIRKEKMNFLAFALL